MGALGRGFEGGRGKGLKRVGANHGWPSKNVCEGVGQIGYIRGKLDHLDWGGSQMVRMKKLKRE